MCVLTGPQEMGIHRFRDIVHTPAAKLLPRHLRVLGGDEDHGDAPRFRIRADPAAEGSHRGRHHDIQEDESGTPGVQDFQRLICAPQSARQTPAGFREDAMS